MTVRADLLHAGGVLQACRSQLVFSSRWISVQTALRMREGKKERKIIFAADKKGVFEDVSFEDSINYSILED